MRSSRVAAAWLCSWLALAGLLQAQTPSAADPVRSVKAPTQSSACCQREIARAKAFIGAGSNDRAIAILQEVLREAPDNGDAHLLLGSALSLVPERSESLKELQKAVELQPSSALAHFTLGTAQARFGDTEAAKRSFETTLKLDPTFAEAHVSLAMLLGQQKDLAAAREHLTQAVKLYGNTTPAAQSHYLLAQILTDQNEPDTALTELDRAIALRPNYAEAFVAQGFIRKWQHNDTAAIGAFKKAAVLSPENFDAHYELGCAYLRADEPSPAVEPLRQAARLKPGDRSTLYQLCKALQQAGKVEQAKACRQNLSTNISAGLGTAANELTSTQANNAGVELEKSGNLTGALEKYREAVKLAPKVTVFRRNMALALCRLGRWDDGIAELHEVLKEDPDDAQATKALFIALENTRAKIANGVTVPQGHPAPK